MSGQERAGGSGCPGDWCDWHEDDKVIVGWLPVDDRVEPTHRMVVASQRDAYILRDVLNALEVQPR